jgi:hypothetical protein
MDFVHRPAGRPGTRGSGMVHQRKQSVSCKWIQLGLGPKGEVPRGLVAQLVEHPLCKRGASGSNPDESTPGNRRPGPRKRSTNKSAAHLTRWTAGTPRLPDKLDNPGDGAGFDRTLADNGGQTNL